MATLKHIKRGVVDRLLPKRRPDSHKGENGRVLIVGGSIDYYGAPVLAGLGAYRAGADLVYLYVPSCNFDSVRALSPDFIVKKYDGEYLTERHADRIIEFGKKKADCVLIGPGLSSNEKTMGGVLEILRNLHIPTVLDADAINVLKKIKKFPLQQPILVTPHQAEFRDLVDRDVVISEGDSKSIVLLRSIAMDLHISVLLKGQKDYVASEDGDVQVNTTGNSGMTVGGSGDVLAGVAAAFMANGVEAFDAARCAAFAVGRAGDYLQKTMGMGYIASELATAVSQALK